MSTVGPLLAALVDDAALFPPGSATMPDAVAGYRRHRAAPHARLVGRFLCPASRLADLQRELDAAGTAGTADTPGSPGLPGSPGRMRIGVVADTGLAGLGPAATRVNGDARLLLDAVEIALRPEADSLAAAARETVAALPDRTAYVEIPRARGWEAALDVVTAYGRGAKLRTGGLTAEAFPSPAEVAAFVEACAERGTPFKCTAGLHHAVRHRDERTGFEHHGFLNLLLATHAAVTRGDVHSVLAERDAHTLAAHAGKLDDEGARRTRELFAGYGSCSIDEPVEDLAALGLL